MQKSLFLFISFVFVSNLTALPEFHHSSSFAKRYEKYLRLKLLVDSQQFDEFENESYEFPTIYDSPWPYFCIDHLYFDPGGCSSWCLDDKGELQLDFDRYGFAEAFIDKELIERVGEKYRFIPLGEANCDYGTCRICQSIIFHGFEEDTDWEAYILYRCRCSTDWDFTCAGNIYDSEHHCFFPYHEAIEYQHPDWHFCKHATIYPGFFNWHYQTYFQFFENFLTYQESNPSCTCYWPQCLITDLISLSVFIQLERLLDGTDFNRIRTSSSSLSPFLQGLSREHFIRGLLTHAFFYSHYLSIINDLDRISALSCNHFEQQKIHTILKEALEEIQPRFINIYSECLKKHPHPKIHYERGMVHVYEGRPIDAINDIREYISYAEENQLEELLTSSLYLQEGRLLNEMLSYNEAIVSLSKAIAKDPENKEAYFERATAYFEIGDLESAVNDYSESKVKLDLIEERAPLSYLKLSQGIALGVAKGGMSSAVDFLPSLFSTTYGLGKGLWACVSNPIGVSKELVESCRACVEFVQENISRELLAKIVPELKECLEKWDQLEDDKKGYYIGYAIGYYGVDILAWGGCARGLKFFRDIKRANTVLTLEAATVSKQNLRELNDATKQFAEWRANFKKKCTLDIGSQDKHIRGKRNFRKGKGELEVSRDRIKELAEKKLGTGLPKKLSFGHAGYIELVDFEEIIGIHVNETAKIRIKTSLGEIHYKENGAYHVVPVNPDKAKLFK